MFFSKVTFLGAVVLAVTALSGQEKIPPPRTPGNTFVTTNFSGVVKVKASPDECFLSLGNNIPYDFIDQTNPSVPCAPGKQPKVNQGYVWGTYVLGTTIYFGTTPNGQCVTQGGIVSDPANLNPYQTIAYACEFQLSPYYPSPISAAQIGDFRPPRIYKFETTTGVVTDITPKAPPGVCLPTNFTCVDPLINATRGVRNVALIPNNPDIMIFGGPALVQGGALNFFAYRLSTQTWVAKTQTNLFDNMRRWVTHNAGGGEVLYAATGNSANFVANPNAGSAVRFAGSFAAIPPIPAPSTGSNIPNCPACFTLQVVGNLDGEGAYLAIHNGRMFINSWPQPNTAGLHMSPVIPPGGLTSTNATQWTKVWSVADYEPDVTMRSAYAGGALLSFGGYLYWGTMNVPWAAFGVIAQTYGVPTDPTAAQALLKNTFRTIVIFRGKDFDLPTKNIELLYGESSLPVYVPNSGPNSATWVQTPTGWTPKYGKSGFGNAYLNYTWSMNIFNNKLYVGTMDWSYMASVGYSEFVGGKITNIVPPQTFGGDLWVFNNTNSAAVAESTTGVGNYTNYGIRNILPIGNKLYLGMANPMNLLTNRNDNIPDGGWELIELTPRGGTVGR